MKTLTHEQADILRSMRSDSRRLVDLVGDMVKQVNGACEHMDENDPRCPVCKVWRCLANAERDLHGLPDEIDRHLERGPHPAGRGR